MISPSAYKLWSVIVCGPCDVQTLHSGILDRANSVDIANEVLLSCLIELSECKLVTIEVHHDYGLQKGTKPMSLPAKAVVHHWIDLFGEEGPSSEPSNKTLMVAASKVLEDFDADYTAYAPIYEYWERNDV